MQLRIAIVADIMYPIPPQHYGGIERAVYLLIKYLLKRGHKVTLFASDDSKVPCQLIPFGHRRSRWIPVELGNLFTLYYRLLQLRNNFDIIHCFGRLLYLLPLMPTDSVKIQSYACPLNRKKIIIANKLAGGTLTFVACSNFCAQGGVGIGRWVTIYNGVDLGQYRFNANPKAGYLVFLGRLHRIKGAHTAIEVAKAANKELILVGNIASCGPELNYFKQEIEPRIDGRQIRYIGQVYDYQKVELLGEASALLFPIEWEEPFGAVMIEAMSCGTPVIAFNKGAVPEVISEGINGFICKSKQEMILAVSQLDKIDRRDCRKTVEMRFSAENVALEFEKLYIELLG
jgi:glycosyltransferase involved in cell wall biosynthesis